jgi:hypothetical protein
MFIKTVLTIAFTLKKRHKHTRPHVSFAKGLTANHIDCSLFFPFATGDMLLLRERASARVVSVAAGSLPTTVESLGLALVVTGVFSQIFG